MNSLPLTSGADLRFDWVALASKAQPAELAAQAQARVLARALAAHGIVTQRGASQEELDERLEAVVETVWPKGRALTGFGLHASLGAYTVAKVAFDLVPAGRTALRHEALKRGAVLAALAEQGIDGHTARAVLGSWTEVPPEFRGDPEGLSASVVAGLAERTLTRVERDAALSQVALSPRCLNRLAATLGLLSAVRALLPVLPPEALGRDVLVAVVALGLGRGARVLELYGDRARTLALRTLVELASAQVALTQGLAPTFADDPLVPRAPVEGARAARARADTEVMGAPAEDDDDDDADDVLDIVEERVDSAVATAPPVLQGPPRPPRWGGAPDAPLDPEALAAYADTLRAARTEVARLGGLMGVAPLPPAPTVRLRGVPPDEALLSALQRRDATAGGDDERTERISIDPLLHGHGLEVEGLPFDPLFPPVRGALRAAVAAAEGVAPALEAVAEAGDLAWALSRARSLALVVQGDLTQAQAAAAGLGDGASPEGRWAADRWLRFGGRDAEPVDPREARAVAAGLVMDLFQQLARTLAGTVPTHG
jgi:hypothetical protein